ncbi:hypothetical protein [Aestuariirhabdus sp. LZHN29]|uniref:hypothetical protein n=1 Tax=Aestuariirhabdus sp. LZHN29 TaxID=3417462 RepID=UPI003CF4CE11
MRIAPVFALLLAALLSASCSSHTPRLEPAAQWVLMPITNYSKDEQAPIQLASMVSDAMAGLGITDLPQMPETDTQGSTPQLHQAHRQQQALQWAAQRNADYRVQGSVSVWGINSQGRAEVEVGLEVIQQADGAPLWQTRIAAAGRRGESPAELARRLVGDGLSSLPLDR